MASLSSKALANFSAASSALMITESLRLIRNYRYYNNLSEDKILRSELIIKIREVRTLTFTLQNLMSKDEPDESPFYVFIAGRINDLFEEIHRKLLFFDSDDIVELIPKIDQQRKFWRNFNDENFYDSDLVANLDSFVPQEVVSIEKNIGKLPVFVTA